MNKVRPKKHLGQHFLNDFSIAQRITELYQERGPVVEVGPGMGVLTQFLTQRENLDLYLVELDSESVSFLKENYTFKNDHLIEGDFLKLNLAEVMNLSASDSFGVIGNFPYNISSQIFLKIFEYRDQVKEVVGMVQKEVGKRIASDPGNKDYGILSVLLQAFYDIEYCFSVPPGAFIPPPKVDSGVIRMLRNENVNIGCDFNKFKLVVKTAFNQRRKKLNNALKPVSMGKEFPYADKRAEQLHYTEFVEITQKIFG